MRQGWALVLLLGALCGCAGSRVNVAPLVDEFDHYARDVKALNPAPPASEVLASGQSKRDEAAPMVEKGDDKKALPIMEQAVADVRVALAAAQADAARRQGDDCLQAMERARQEWEEAILTLQQTEQVAARAASDVPREIPDPAEGLSVSFPRSNLSNAEAPALEAAEMAEAWKAWLAVASARQISTADLQSRFESRLEKATNKKTDDKWRPIHLYLAGRALQELEARVRGEVADQTCARATAQAARLAGARDQALRATLELERGLKGDLLSELEKARAEARDRQTELYQALQTLEGKFARITQAAHGTIVSLADILFDFDKSTLKRNVEFNLVKVATILNQFEEMKILVEGHTDNIGTPEYNLDLSKRRAQAVYEFLVSQEVTPERMTVEGYGMTRPVAENDSDEGRQKNRRVDLVIQGKP